MFKAGLRCHRSVLSMILLLGLFCMFLTGCGKEKEEKSAGEASGYDIVDYQGTTVHIPAKPKRIMSFMTGTDEILLGLVEPERMVAINKEFADPSRSNVYELSQRIPHVIERNPPVERIISLQPDLNIVHAWISQEKIETIREFHIPVVVVKSPKSLAEIHSTIRLIAAAIGEPERGEKLISKMGDELSKLKEKIDAVPAEKRGKRIAFISVMAGYGGRGSIFDDYCKFADAKNAKALAGIKEGQVMAKEQLLEMNPDILMFPSYHEPNSPEERYGAEYRSDPSLQTLTAIRENRVLEPWAHYVYNISQNFVFGVQEMAYVLYGDEFEQPTTRHLSVAEE